MVQASDAISGANIDVPSRFWSELSRAYYIGVIAHGHLIICRVLGADNDNYFTSYRLVVDIAIQ